MASTIAQPADYKPTVLPLRVAFELRPAVVKAEAEARLPSSLRHVPCTLALCQGIKQVKTSADIGIVMRLALEVVFGMAKTVPMSRAAIESVAGVKQDSSYLREVAATAPPAPADAALLSVAMTKSPLVAGH